MKRVGAGLVIVGGLVAAALWWARDDGETPVIEPPVIELNGAEVVGVPNEPLAVNTAPAVQFEEPTPDVELHAVLVLDVGGRPHSDATVFLLSDLGRLTSAYRTNADGLVDIPVRANTGRLVATAPERGLLEHHVEQGEPLPNFLHLIAATRVVVHVTRDGAPYPTAKPAHHMRLQTRSRNPFARDERHELARAVKLEKRREPRWIAPGRFVIDDVTPGRQHFRIEPGGHASATVREGVETSVFIEARRWPTLSGTVAVDGHPRAGVHVERIRPYRFGPIRSSHGGGPGDHLTDETTTDANGHWELPGAEGLVHVVARLGDGAQVDELVDLEYDEHREVDLVLHLRPRSGIVVDTLGLPIEGAYVSAEPHGGKTTTAADGGFELPFCSADARELHAGHQSEAAFLDLTNAGDELRIELTRRCSLAVSLSVDGMVDVTDEQILATRMNCEIYDAEGDLFDREPAQRTTLFSGIPVGAWSVALVSADGATTFASGDVLVVAPSQTARMQLAISADALDP